MKILFSFLLILIAIQYVPFAFAQQYQTIKTIDVSVGNPTAADGTIGGFVNAIRAACPGGRVVASTYHCIDKIPNLPPRVRDQLEYDGRKGAPLQCGIFIEAILMYINKPLLWGAAPTAFSWWPYYLITSHQGSYRPILNIFGNQLQVGDITIWFSGATGHIGYVTRVYNKTTFDAAEANFSAGVVDIRRYTTDGHPLRLVGWLRGK